jgi:hypothetical protein
MVAVFHFRFAPVLQGVAFPPPHLIHRLVLVRRDMEAIRAHAKPDWPPPPSRSNKAATHRCTQTADPSSPPDSRSSVRSGTDRLIVWGISFMLIKEAEE